MRDPLIPTSSQIDSSFSHSSLLQTTDSHTHKLSFSHTLYSLLRLIFSLPTFGRQSLLSVFPSPHKALNERDNESQEERRTSDSSKACKTHTSQRLECTTDSASSPSLREREKHSQCTPCSPKRTRVVSRALRETS